jgi:protein-L-isoaspartate(D-aspartate) O-methyltransferase
MTAALELEGKERVLEIGTGSGYQAAILSNLAAAVYTIELVPELAAQSKARLAQLGYSNVEVRAGDGYRGWPEKAPFDRIVVTAAPDVLPRTLLDQLAEGGVLVAPVGAEPASQQLLRYRKKDGRITSEDLGAVRFVPMVPGDRRTTPVLDASNTIR